MFCGGESSSLDSSLWVYITCGFLARAWTAWAAKASFCSWIKTVVAILSCYRRIWEEIKIKGTYFIIAIKLSLYSNLYSQLNIGFSFLLKSLSASFLKNQPGCWFFISLKIFAKTFFSLKIKFEIDKLDTSLQKGSVATKVNLLIKGAWCFQEIRCLFSIVEKRDQCHSTIQFG